MLDVVLSQPRDSSTLFTRILKMRKQMQRTQDGAAWLSGPWRAGTDISFTSGSGGI